MIEFWVDSPYTGSIIGTLQKNGPSVNRRLLLIFVVLIAAAAGAYAFSRQNAGGDGAAAGAGATAAAKPPAAVMVETATVTEAPLDITAESVGTLKANEQTPIKAEVTGRIAAIHFEEGAHVKAGDVLVTLDASVQEAEVHKAEANLRLRRVNHQRAVQLLQKGVGTVERRDEATASLKDAEATLDLARARLEKMFLRAPFDGIVGLRVKSPGDITEVGQTIAVLVDTDPIKIDFSLPEIYLTRVFPGQKVTVLPEAIGTPYEGTVYAIDPIVNETGRNLMLRATIPNGEHVLKPGLFARVSLTLEERGRVMLVPEEAVFPVGMEQFVYRIDDGKVTRQKVTVGIRREGMVEIREGLEAGAEIMTAGHMKVREGAPVQTAAPPASVPVPTPAPAAGTP